MGLTSGQGRLLMLTSRLSDIQLDQILISRRQNQLAWQSEKAAKEYNEKTTNMKLVMKVNDKNETAGYKTEDITYDNMTSMGYLVTDAQNKIYLTKDTDGNWVLPKASNLSDNNIFDGGVETGDDGKPYVKVKNKDIKYEVVDATDILSDKAKLQNNLMNGVMLIFNTTGNDTFGSDIGDMDSNTSMQMVYDTSDDAEAESKYNYQTAQISRQDNVLDMEMKQLETQQNAVSKEIESVQKLIDTNIEKTFKLFSD